MSTKSNRTIKLAKKCSILGISYLAIDHFHPQRGADIRGSAKGLTNAFIAFPLVGRSFYNYVYGLKGLEYGTDEYIEKRSEIHKMVATRIKYMSHNCGGIYFKAGQYIGTLERLMPKEYTDELKSL
jgi:aarF domain-containing kinase